MAKKEEQAAILRAAGIEQRPVGHCVLSGPALQLFDAVDEALREISLGWAREEVRAPAFILAEDLDRYDYFSSFPHLALLPAALDAEVLKRAAQRPRIGARGELVDAKLASPRHVLTPAACYHVYRRFEGRALETTSYSAVSATCFRNEATSEPLVRQNSFTMRETVCLGRPSEVKSFLEQGRVRVRRVLEALDVGCQWRPAKDPFFGTSGTSRQLFQTIAPVKYEAMAGDLAVASTNRHGDFFCSAHGISVDGRPAHSGCLAFGVERWLHVLIRRWGPDPAGWARLLGILRKSAAPDAATPE